MFRRTRTATSRLTNRINNLGKSRRFWVQPLEERTVPAAFLVDLSSDTGSISNPGVSGDLRYVLGLANANGTADVITFDPTVTTVNLAGSSLPQYTENQDLTINGNGKLVTTLNAAVGNRIFDFSVAAGNPTITITDMTLNGGSVAGNGGAILNTNEALVLTNLQLSNNTAASGGALATSGVSTITGSSFISNRSTAVASGYLGGGAVFFSGASTVTLNSSSFQTNTSSTGGGAIFSANATLSMNSTGASFTGNICTGTTNQSGGGAIFVGGGGSTITFNNATMTGNTGARRGGAFYNYNSGGTYNFNNCTISNNKTTSAASGGGAIYSFSPGLLTFSGSTVANNTANGGVGGGIRSSGTTTITNSIISGNAGATLGGGVYCTSTLNLNSTTIDSNTSTTSGGGLHTTSTVNVNNPVVAGIAGVTVSNNSSLLGGGWNITGGTVTIRNATIAKNTATGTLGGGGLNLTAGTLNLQNSTVAVNAANGVGATGGGFRRAGTVTINLSSSIVADNTSTAGGADGHSTVAAGVTIGLNNSLIGTNVPLTSNITFNGTGQQNVASGLDPAGLQLNGAVAGTPLTIGILAGSLAINTGNNLQLLTTDARGAGFPRAQGAGTDVGAFELPSTIPSASGGPYASITTVSPDYTFTVTYADNDSNIDLTTLDNNDITVSGSPAFAVPVNAVFVSSTGAAKSVTATYKITPSDSSFDGADNGTYTISVNAGQVFDTDGVPNSVPAGTVNTFRVSIPTNYIVNATNDELVDTDTKTSLREALAFANADTSTADSITFDAAVFASLQTITLALGEMKISGAVTITGPSVGVVIDAATLSRVMNVDVPALTAQKISISNMTLTNGKLTSGNGGGILNNDEALSLTNVTVQNSTTVADGGGIAVATATGSLSLTNSTINNNTTTGATYANGGGIFLSGASAVTISGSTISNNSSGEDGGGIYFFSGGSLTMTNSTVSGNKSNTLSTSSGGGGIYLFNTTTTIIQSTISGNSTNSGGKDANGGGIVAQSTSNVTIRNSTIAFNNAGTKSGGGVHNNGSAAITLDSTIVSDNTATTGPDVNGAVNADFSLFSSTAGATITGANNITANAQLNPLALNGGTTLNHLPTASSPVFNKGANTLGLTTDQRGGNRTLDGVIDIGSVESPAPASSPPLGSATAPNITVGGGSVNTITVVYTDAESNINITKLDNNDLQVTGPGGPYGVVFKTSTPAGLSVTATYEVTAPGGTFDAADNGTYSINVVAGEVFDTDVPTPQSVAAGKIGSYNVAVAANFVVNATNDETVDTDGKTSLREALASSNATVGLSDSISFDPVVFAAVQTITLALGQLDVTDAVTITGPTVGVVVDAATLSRVMNVSFTGSGAKVSVSNMSLINGSSGATNGGGIFNDAAALTLTNCNVTGNVTTADGGGISVANAAGSLTLVGCTVSNNKATSTTSQGGGIHLSNGSTVSVDRSTISGNESGEDGGGFYFFFNGSLTVTNSTISGNKADTGAAGVGGGGIYFYGTAGTFLISNSTISGNIANNGGIAGYGGGVLLNVFTGNSVIRNSTIAFNDAGKSGGGIAQGGGSSTWDSTIIASNTVAGVNAATSDVFFVAAITVAGDSNLIGIQDVATKATFGGTTQTGSLATPLNPLLDVLALNGAPVGSPFTHALKAGSPAINKGNNVAPALAFDQRGTGFNRSVGVTDVGAFEVQASVTAVAINSKLLTPVDKAQRSYVSDVAVTFDSIVTFTGTPEAAFTLDKVGGGSVTLSANVDNTGPGTVVTLTFTGGSVDATSLADGRYALHVLSAGITGGLAGGDFIFDEPASPATLDASKIFRIYGDYEGDGDVDTADFIQFRLALGNSSPPFQLFDFDNDGAVATSDFIQFRLRFGGAI